MNREPGEAASYSFDELVERAGQPSRTVRSYFEQRLLRGPETKGRYARYGAYHLERLLAIKALRDQQGLSTEETRQALMRMSDEEVRALASSPTADPPGAPPRRGLASFFEEREADYLGAQPPLSAADMRRAASGMAANSPPRVPLPAAPRAQARTTPPVAHLLEQLQLLLGRRQPSARRSSPEPWYRVPITPDIELTVRGPRSPEELEQFERIAAYLREVLLGGLAGPYS